MGTHSCIPMWNCVSSGTGGFTSLHTRVRSPCHRPLCTCRPVSPRHPSNPHLGQQLLTHTESPKAKYFGSKSGPHCSSGMQLQHLNSKVPRLYFNQKNPPAPKGQPQTARRSLQRLTALASVAVPLPQLPSQLDANGKMFTRKTPAHSTPLSAPQSNGFLQQCD